MPVIVGDIEFPTPGEAEPATPGTVEPATPGTAEPATPGAAAPATPSAAAIIQPYQTPGVYLEERVSSSRGGLSTGVPVFIGQVETTPVGQADNAEAFALMHWQEFSAANKFGIPVEGSYLFSAVKGFFENGGKQCYILGLSEALSATVLLQVLQSTDIFLRADLICVPDIINASSEDQILAMQNIVLNFCQQDGTFFAILDSLQAADLPSVVMQREALNLSSGALYYPWIQVAGGMLPPCGHVAGIYARTDEKVGVFKSPANEIVREVAGLERSIKTHEHSILNPLGINVIRAFPGRGIRVMGARALGSQGRPFSYVSARRLFITLRRWANVNLLADVFEPNTPRLWASIVRRVGTYLNDLYVQGAFQGDSPVEAYYVKCDAENNPEHIRDSGVLVVDVGILPADVNEFIVLRLVRNDQGLQLSQVDSPSTGDPVNTPPQLGSAVRVWIERIVLDPSTTSFEQEHLVLRNLAQYSLPLSGWVIRDKDNIEYQFPEFTLGPYASVNIWTGSGSDNSANLYWGRAASVWTNNGNTATLSDANSDTITTHCYLV